MRIRECKFRNYEANCRFCTHPKFKKFKDQESPVHCGTEPDDCDLAKEAKFWHCPSDMDRELAEMLVRTFGSDIWQQMSEHYKKSYPYSLADKYDLIYTFLGCKAAKEKQL